MTLRTIYDHEKGRFVLMTDAPKANAFDWKNWECPISGKINWRPQNLASQNSKKLTDYVEKKRETSPTHGTLYGMTDKDVSVAPPKRMKKAPNETKELSSAVLAGKPKAKRGKAQGEARER